MRTNKKGLIIPHCGHLPQLNLQANTFFSFEKAMKDSPEGRGHGLGVLAEDEAEVDVEHLARGVDHDIVQVAVADAQDVRDHAVPRAALDESVQRTENGNKR